MVGVLCVSEHVTVCVSLVVCTRSATDSTQGLTRLVTNRRSRIRID
jgi:hypothetical protein